MAVADLAGIAARMADVALEAKDKSTMRAADITAVPIIVAGDFERLKRIKWKAAPLWRSSYAHCLIRKYRTESLKSKLP
jgi:hypothetical protein